jgi:hypothetical protein
MILPGAAVAARLWAALTITTRFPMTNPTPHRATPEQWQRIETSHTSCVYDSVMIELRDRLAAAEQRISELEGNPSAQQEIREAQTFGPGPAGAPAAIVPITDREPMPQELDSEGRCWVYDPVCVPGWMLIYERIRNGEPFLRNGRPFLPHWALPIPGQEACDRQPEPASAAPAESLVEALMDKGYGKTHARAAILAVADWLESYNGGPTSSTHALREEVERG